MASGVKISDMVPVPSGTLMSGDEFEIARLSSPNNFTYSTTIDDISAYIQNSVTSSYGNMFFHNNSRPTHFSTPLPSINRIEAGPTVPAYPPADYSGYGSGLLANFTLSNGRLVYNGTESIVALVECSLAIFDAGPLTGNPIICIRKNSSVLSQMNVLIVSGNPLNVSLNTLVTLNPGNNIDIAIDNIDIISYTVTDLQVTVIPVINLGTSTTSTIDLQDAYNNGSGSITLSSGKPFELDSTVAGFLMPQMSQAQFQSIASPSNGLISWAYDTGRIIVNFGTPLAPNYDSLAYLADLDIITLQTTYDNGAGYIVLSSDKPFALNSTVAGFLPPQMTQTQFEAIALPDNGLIAWATDQNRIIINSGISLSPSYDLVAYVNDLTLQTTYDNSGGYINLIGGKPFALYSTAAGFIMPQMSTAQFEAIPVPDNGLLAWSNDSSRIIVNSGTEMSPSYDLVAYVDDLGSITLQNAYDNGTGQISLVLGQPFQLNSTVTGFVMPRMTNAQFLAISPTTNGLMGWETDNDRIIVNTGSNVSPFFNEIAYISDISIIPTLQDAYTNGNGKITLITGKPFELDSTVAGFLTPSMNSASFQAITSPANGLLAWAADLNRFIVNKGTSGSPSYDELAYLSEATLQGGYTNGTGQISLIAGKPFQLNSTVAGFVMPRMTNAQFVLISSPTNGLMGWETDNDRIIVNTGSNITPFFNEVAYLSDISTVPTLQDTYNNGNGKINLSSGKPFELDSTVAGFIVPSMTNTQFQAIATPANGLMGWDTTNNRIIVNSGTSGTPIYGQVAYTSDITIATLQTAYNNGTGAITLSTGKPFTLSSTTAGFLMTSMTNAQFQAISSPANGLVTWATDLLRFLVNKGTSGSPLYSQIAYTTDLLTITLQNGYDNGTGIIAVATGKPFSLTSTTAGFLVPKMTNAQFTAISTPANGLLGWDTTNNRFITNTGTSGSPVYGSLAYTSDLPTVTLQAAYNNGTGIITVATGKPFTLSSTTAGALMPQMTQTQFQAITSPANGLFAWANDLNRFTVNKGTAGTPSYDQLAYLSEITLQAAYTNGTGIIAVATGKPFSLTSTTAGFLVPKMTNAQFTAISTPANGLLGWDTTNNRFITNTGTSGSPVYDSLAYLSESTLQGGYTNGTGQITLLSGKPFQLNSNVAGMILPRMLLTEFKAISTPANGLMVWSTGQNRIWTNSGTSGTPVYSQIPFFTDITLQLGYDNDTGIITLATGKPFTLSSTTAGFLVPKMTNAQFTAISSPPNGLMAWDTTNNRFIVNSGTSGTPVYSLLKYTSDPGPLSQEVVYKENLRELVVEILRDYIEI